MLDNLNKYHIILGSNSPRRRKLLAILGLTFEVRSIRGIDESYPSDLTGIDIPQYISRKKAAAYAPSLKDNELLITADTIVWAEGKVLGKPHDDADAKRMLRFLSSRTHQVFTGVTLRAASIDRTFAAVSEVTFDALSDDDINYYVARCHPLDKAGAYGIQEWIGCVGVSALKGSYFNVMGLPVQRLYKELKTL